MNNPYQNLTESETGKPSAYAGINVSMGAGIGHLMSDEAFGPLEDIAMVKLAHLTNDTKEYMHLVQILNLEAALERARKKRESA